MDNEKIEVRTDEIIEYLKDKKYQDAKKLVLENNAVDIAEIIEEIIDEISIEKAVVTLACPAGRWGFEVQGRNVG